MRTSLRQASLPRRRPQPDNDRQTRARRLVAQHPRRHFLNLAMGTVALPAVSRIAIAQTYPSRPITLVVPFPAGGATDFIARLIAARMSAPLGRPIVVENLASAAGILGVGRVARAAADGYTLTLGNFATHVTNGAIFTLTYDVLKDFQPIALITDQPYLILTRTTFPADDLNGLIRWLHANPGRASAATQGAGLVDRLFQNATGAKYQFVPYRGGAPALQDLVAGQVDLMLAPAGDALSLVRAGSIKAFAVLGKARLAAAKDIPTIDEAGLSGFYYSNWFGLWAPAGTPKDIISRLNAAAVEALADQMVRSRLADIGQEIFPRAQQTPEALGELQKAEIDKWWPFIKAAGIKAQ
jgi:tripartite-type tricarboxylate transporter receptor subunit TctC